MAAQTDEEGRDSFEPQPYVSAKAYRHYLDALLARNDDDYATAAHETGHVFGRFDDYDMNLNPPKVGNRIDDPGYWVTRSLPVNPFSRTTYYSFMGASDPGSQYWVDRATYLAILQSLQSGTDLGP